jgi:hypothetical protein
MKPYGLTDEGYRVGGGQPPVVDGVLAGVVAAVEAAGTESGGAVVGAAGAVPLPVGAGGVVSVDAGAVVVDAVVALAVAAVEAGFVTVEVTVDVAVEVELEVELVDTDVDPVVAWVDPVVVVVAGVFLALLEPPPEFWRADPSLTLPPDAVASRVNAATETPTPHAAASRIPRRRVRVDRRARCAPVWTV